MLEKNKDYIEMRVFGADCTFIKDEAKISIKGYSCGTYWRLPDPDEDYILISKEKFEALQTENEQLKKKLEELHREVTWTCDELGRANSANNSWKAAAECNAPRELMVKLNQLRDDIKELKERYDLAVEMIGRWQRATGQFLPNVDDDELASWKEVTGFKTPEEAKDYWTTKLRESCEVNESFAREIRSWREATKCKTPEEAKKAFTDAKEEIRVQTRTAHSYREQLDGFVELYEDLEGKHKELESQIEEWKTITKCKTPGEAKVLISTLTKTVIFNEMNKDCPVDFEFKFVRGDKK